MTDENEIDQNGPTEGITTPEEPTHEATTPPGNSEVDADKVADAEDELGKAGGGH